MGSGGRITGAEMKGQGKQEATWPTPWMAPNKNDKKTAHPPSTRALVPAEIDKAGDGLRPRERRGFSARSAARVTAAPRWALRSVHGLGSLCLAPRNVCLTTAPMHSPW